MVTQDGHFAVSIVVCLDLLRDSARGLHVPEQVTHSEGGVVGTEHLCSQAGHVVLQVLVESGRLLLLARSVTRERGKPYSQSVKDLVAVLLGWLLKDLQVLEDLRINLNLVVESNAVLAQEVENDGVRWL